MDLRSSALCEALQAEAANSRKFCRASLTSARVLSAWVMELRWDSRARWSVSIRASRVMARSAWAAPVGSSLARTTFLPDVRFSCRLDRSEEHTSELQSQSN